MIKKKASELKVGDVFCREMSGGANPPRGDAIFTVEKLQFIPVRDFFGKYFDTIKISAQNRLLGPASLTLGADESVWLVD